MEDSRHGYALVYGRAQRAPRRAATLPLRESFATRRRPATAEPAARRGVKMSMQRATITLHLPTHRRESIKAYGESWRMLDQVYDGHIGDYVEFLRRQARDRGFEVRTDWRDVEPAFSIAER